MRRYSPQPEGATSTNSLMIKLQAKIYDHIMLTVRISFIPSVCSQVPSLRLTMDILGQKFNPPAVKIEKLYRFNSMIHVFIERGGSARQDHWEAFCPVLRYLKKTPGKGLFFKRKDPILSHGRRQLSLIGLAFRVEGLVSDGLPFLIVSKLFSLKM
ncbi:cytochrome c biogenesis FC [Capsicum annuum]|nr:cytochrome c biogenesis FC [Capsicum annuum]